jgi:hypothetical protein
VLIKAIPKPENTPAEQFGPAAEELFSRIMQMTDNAGATDEHRGAELPSRAVSGYPRQGGRGIREGLFAHWSGSAALAFGRRA